MVNEGKYLYCVIEETSFRSFGPIGIGGRGDDVQTLCYRDLACVISSSPTTDYLVSRKNLMSHEKVIEEVMKEYTVLPVRFSTVAEGVEDIRRLLAKSSQGLKNLLRAMDNKVEMGLKVLWRDMDRIFKEIVVADKEIADLNEKLRKKTSPVSLEEKVALGEAVKHALEAKKEAEAQRIVRVLRPKCTDSRLNETIVDRMLLNGAFLIDRIVEREFDDLVNGLEEKHKDRFQFKFVGPSPPFNFVNLVIRWREI
jgi:hypothetical protein